MSAMSPPKRFAVLVWTMAGVCLATLLAAGLRPFNFKPRNEVEWLPGGRGIRFLGRGMVLSRGRRDSVSRQYRDSDGITIEILAQSGPRSKHGASRIVSFYDHEKTECFFLGLQDSQLVFWVRNIPAPGRRQLTYRGIALGALLTDGAKHLVSLASGRAGTSVYLDGILKRYQADFIPRAQNIRSMENYVLGNSPVGKDPWEGTLFGLALYNRLLVAEEILENERSWKHDGRPGPNHESMTALYLFDERPGTKIKNSAGTGPGLDIPATFQPLKKSLLMWPTNRIQLNRSWLADVTINIAGFIPFGLVFSALLLKITRRGRRRAYFLTLLLGSATSLVIECLQFYLPTRSSDLSDWILNTIGTALGIAAFSICLPILASKKWSGFTGGGGG